jgi:hypothetical protein
MNEPRTIPYDFKAARLEGELIVFDDSAREYPCAATPHIWCEFVEDRVGFYLTESQLKRLTDVEDVEVKLGPEVPHWEAWNEAISWLT